MQTDTRDELLKLAVEAALEELTAFANALHLKGMNVAASGVQNDIIAPLRRALAQKDHPHD